MSARALVEFIPRDMLLLVALLLGVYLTIRGIRNALGGVFRPGQDQWQVLERAKGYRVFIIGMATLGLSIGFATDSTWLIVVSLGIGGQELFESSVVIGAMKYGLRR